MLTKSFLNREYYRNKKSVLAIAKELNMSPTTIYYQMNKFGFKCRDRASYKIGIKLSKKHKEKLRNAKIGLYGEKSNRWEGGLKLVSGYIHIRVNGKYIKRSRIVMEYIIGRKLKKGEVVHHKGINHPISSKENKLDDTEENLQLCNSGSEHRKIHCELNKMKESV